MTVGWLFDWGRRGDGGGRKKEGCAGREERDPSDRG